MADVTDPTRATSLSLDRRTFVGLSASATAAAASASGAMAQSALGRPHPPLVAEDDPAITTSRPQIQYGARTLDAYYAAPRNPGPATRAVVIVQAIWGVDAQLRDVTRRYAKEGYFAIAPDLYAGLDAPSGDERSDFDPFRAVARKLSDDVVDADLAAAAAFLRQTSSRAQLRVGITGFCMGGAIALRQTVNNAATFSAASVFYGAVRYGTTGSTSGAITPIALDYADEIGMPLMGSYGGRDTSIPAADVRALDAKLRALQKDHDLRIYDDAGHAFFDDTRSSYVPDAAADSWVRTLAWFHRYLT